MNSSPHSDYRNTPEVPVDLVMILDRTGSMNGVDTDNARRAADSVRADLARQLKAANADVNMVYFLAALQSVDAELYEAATIDGAGYSVGGTDPRWVMMAPVEAAKKLADEFELIGETDFRVLSKREILVQHANWLNNAPGIPWLRSRGQLNWRMPSAKGIPLPGPRLLSR